MTAGRLPRIFGAMALVFGLGGAMAIAPSPLGSVAQAQSGVRNPAAEQFVQTQAQRALDILSQHRGNVAEEKRLFRAFVDQVADVPRITFFVLGKYGRSITPTQRQAFCDRVPRIRLQRL